MKAERPTKEQLSGLESIWHYFYRSDMGTDPEMFAFEGKKLVPAFAYLPHKDKAETFRVSYSAELQCKLFWDGFQAEWAYNTGMSCLSYLVDMNRDSLIKLNEALKAKFPKAELSLKNVVRIPDKVLENAPDPFVALGCKPSKNVYGREQLHVKDPRKLLHRCAGGHIHAQLQKAQKEDREGIIRCIDKVAGVWSVAAANGIDDPIRRKSYGLAGEWRPTSYGVEYRTPSNFWQIHPVVMHGMFEMVRAGISLWNTGHSDWWVAPEEEVQHVINNYDVKGAIEILERNEEFLRFLTGISYDEEIFKGLMKIAKDSAIKLFPEDFEKNWKFKAGSWVYHSDGTNESLSMWDVKL